MASVDVASPCCQHGRFLRRFVASILSQEIRNIAESQGIDFKSVEESSKNDRRHLI